MTKGELIDFLFWLQYEEQSKLLDEWNNALASNSFVAQKYMEYLDDEHKKLGLF